MNKTSEAELLRLEALELFRAVWGAWKRRIITLDEFDTMSLRISRAAQNI
jgi:hypothetical protein